MRAALHLNRMDFDIVCISKVVILYLFVQCSWIWVWAAWAGAVFYTISLQTVWWCWSRSAPWKDDKFACFCDYFQQINNRFLLLRLPSRHTAIDETLSRYCGLINIKQYNTGKPAKYLLLYRSICDLEVQYAYLFPSICSKTHWRTESILCKRDW